ncbi:hypothetical protein CVT25_006531 [Psilocybe cyanescens]|uniref:Uncharacterized protein n=1 Tax=Psilocybe cyanescens TaxID=93625 RepID=A0A409XED8_PSICY|nr:hypothetical protein CVT25_006531 [Psilocybe cyanescens]
MPLDSVTYGSGLCDLLGGSLIPLPAGAQGQYYDPYHAKATPCMCNTVTYSLVSACGICQGQTYLYWHQWVDVCDGASTGVWLYKFPEPLPPDLDVPAWAYMDVTTTDFFHIDEAFQNATSSVRSAGTQTQAFSTPSNALPTSAAPSSTGGTSISNSNVTYNMAPAPSEPDNGSKMDVGAMIGAITGSNQKEKKRRQDEESHGLVSPTATYVELKGKGSKGSKKGDDEWDSEIDIDTDAHGETDYHLHG